MTEGSEGIVMEDDKKAAMRARAAKARAAKRAKAEADEAAVHAAPVQPSGRVWITLEENESIPREGQFFGLNGASYLLRAGVKANVPRGIVDILDNAIESYAIKDPVTLKIIDVRSRLRYPYRLHGAA